MKLHYKHSQFNILETHCVVYISYESCIRYNDHDTKEMTDKMKGHGQNGMFVSFKDSFYEFSSEFLSIFHEQKFSSLVFVCSNFNGKKTCEQNMNINQQQIDVNIVPCTFKQIFS